MIKRLAPEIRERLKKKKEELKKLDKLIKLLIQKGVIKKEELEG